MCCMLQEHGGPVQLRRKTQSLGQPLASSHEASVTFHIGKLTSGPVKFPGPYLRNPGHGPEITGYNVIAISTAYHGIFGRVRIQMPRDRFYVSLEASRSIKSMRADRSVRVYLMQIYRNCSTRLVAAPTYNPL
jgi:hypothetical protein